MDFRQLPAIVQCRFRTPAMDKCNIQPIVAAKSSRRATAYKKGRPRGGPDRYPSFGGYASCRFTAFGPRASAWISKLTA